MDELDPRGALADAELAFQVLKVPVILTPVFILVCVFFARMLKVSASELILGQLSLLILMISVVSIRVNMEVYTVVLSVVSIWLVAIISGVAFLIASRLGVCGCSSAPSEVVLDMLRLGLPVVANDFGMDHSGHPSALLSPRRSNDAKNTAQLLFILFCFSSALSYAPRLKAMEALIKISDCMTGSGHLQPCSTPFNASL